MRFKKKYGANIAKPSKKLIKEGNLYTGIEIHQFLEGGKYNVWIY